MPKKKQKTFLLRVDQETFQAIQRLADDELRSLNGQIEYLLREALTRRGRRTAPTRKP